MKRVEVVAAFIQASDRFLIARRTAGLRAGRWELPGGKQEAGESRQQALEREIREEMNASIKASEEIAAINWDYPDISVSLHLLKAQLIAGEPEQLEHSALAWIRLDDADEYDLCEADRELIRQLKEKHHCSANN